MSIILDTNVLSELNGRTHSEHILVWLNGFDPGELFLTTISIAEMQFGLSLLPTGRRRDALMETYGRIEDGFRGRIISFTQEAAHAYGKLSAQRKIEGRGIETKDAMIAAICLVHGARLATRNIKDFDGLDLKLINPFEGA
jgi:toxin FitB